MKAECPECGWSREVPTNAMGQKAKCPKCETVFRVSGSETEDPAKGQNPSKPPSSPEKKNSLDRFHKKVLDHLEFRSFLTPTLLQIIYSFLFGITVLGIVGTLLIGVFSEKLPLGGGILVIIGFVAALIFARITLEGIIVIFSIHDRLKEISDELTS